ncbi:MAG TPA: T9SS type A sorting domain-containing protein [bacterium]|nr:T9SS type A sorting domain-containing protein [bacterium]
MRIADVALCIVFIFFHIPAHAQNLPWTDNFEDGNMDGWMITDDAPFRSGPSNWTVSNGALYQTSDIRTTENELSVYKGTHAAAGNPDWSDYYYAAKIYTSDDEGIGMLFRYQDENNYYRFLTLGNTNHWGSPFKRLEKQVHGRFTTLAQSTDDVKIPGGFIGKIHAAGDSILVFEDEKLLFSVRDGSFSRGKIGLMCYANRGALFDDIYVGDRDTLLKNIADPKDPPIVKTNRELVVKALTLNIWVNGKICTPAQVADLILSLNVDFAGLQECNNAFGKAVADLTGMHMASGFDCYLFSKTPYTKINSLFINGINGWTNIDGQTVSVYNFHIRWDEEGDRHANTMVATLKNDPIPIQIAIGDFNDEHYSTQISIIEKHMRLCLLDLGWAPSQRVTWPAFGFYGGEGAQMIDLVFCNKASKGRAVAGEIMNASPLLSDHKPVWATLKFPADKDTVGPRLTKVTPYLGAEMIDLWFDQDLDSTSVQNKNHYRITPLDGGSSVSVVQTALVKDARRVRVITSPHEDGKSYRIHVSGVTDEFGVPVTANAAEKSYTMRQNLLENFGAEAGTSHWELYGGMTAVSERENQFPYTGGYFFTGENLQDLSTASQTVNLRPWADEIDQGRVAAEWNAYFATGYELLGEIRASRCEPYDEGEMIVDFIDGDNRVLHQASSKRWDTLFWHPYGETTNMPPGTRSAVVRIHSYRKIKNGLSNDAAFDNVFFAIKHLEQSHGSGSNLLINPSAETGDLTGWTVSDSIRVRAHEEEKARPLSGYYMFANAGISTAQAHQEFDFSQMGARIDAGNLAVRWGGYMRDYDGASAGEIKLEFYDVHKSLVGEVSTGEQRIAEWWHYDTESIVPPNTRYVKYIFKLNAVADEGVYFDFLHLIPVEKTGTSILTRDRDMRFTLLGNYPNPFNAGTTIEYGCTRAGHIKLTVYNLLGQTITTLTDAYHDAGHYQLTWNGEDRLGNNAPSGVYLYQLETEKNTETKKMLLLR